MLPVVSIHLELGEDLHANVPLLAARQVFLVLFDKDAFRETAMGGEKLPRLTWRASEEESHHTRESMMCGCRKRRRRCLKVLRSATHGTAVTPRSLFSCDAIPRCITAKGATELSSPVRWSIVLVRSFSPN